jgi:pimeloyl-ACP methyl ester carboxylesterase
MPYADSGGRRLFYAQSRSRRSGVPPLLLIHGAGGNHLHWPPELRRLSDAHIYALDLPGHGRSDGPAHHSIADYASAVIGFLDAAHIARAVLVGHSMGGAIGQWVALTHPERVAGLVLIGTGARLRVAPAILDGVLNDFASTIEFVNDCLWGRDASAELIRQARRILAETAPEVMCGDYVACDTFDVMGRLGEIATPTLVIAGTADRLTPHKYGAYLADHIPGARLFTVEGGGHMMVLEQPDVVGEAVAEFVSNLVPAASIAVTRTTAQ